MPDIFQPVFITVGVLAVLVGGLVGEFVARVVPHQRILIAVSLWVGVGVMTFAGIGLRQPEETPHVLTVGDFAVIRHMAVVGLMLGAGLMLSRRARMQQVFGLAGLAVIGLPLATNFWLGAGLAQATYGA